MTDKRKNYNKLNSSGAVLFSNPTSNKIKAKSKQLSSNASNHSLHRRNITVAHEGQTAFQVAYGNVILPLDFATTPSENDSHKLRLRNFIPLGQSPQINVAHKTLKSKFLTNTQSSEDILRVVSISSVSGKNSFAAIKSLQESQLILPKSNPSLNLPDVKAQTHLKQQKNKKTRNMILIKSNSIEEDMENSRLESSSPSLPIDIKKIGGSNSFLIETHQPDNLKHLQHRATNSDSPSHESKSFTLMKEGETDNHKIISAHDEERMNMNRSLRSDFNQKSMRSGRKEPRGQIGNINNNKSYQNLQNQQNEEYYSQIVESQLLQQQTPRMKGSDQGQRHKKFNSVSSLQNSIEKSSPQIALVSNHQSPSSQKQLLNRLLQNSSQKSSFVAADESKINLTLDSNESPQQVIFEFQKQIKKNIRTLSNVPPMDPQKKDLLVLDPNYKIQDERYNHYYNAFNNENVKPQNINGGVAHAASGPQQNSSGMAVLKPPLYQNSILNSTGSFILNNDLSVIKPNDVDAVKARESRKVQHQKGVKSIDNLRHLNNYLTNKNSLPLQNQFPQSNYQSNSIIASPQLNNSNSLSRLQQSPNGKRASHTDSSPTAASSFLPQIKSVQSSNTQVIKGSKSTNLNSSNEKQKPGFGQKFRDQVHQAQLQDKTISILKSQVSNKGINSIKVSASVDEGKGSSENAGGESIFANQYSNSNGRLIQSNNNNNQQEPSIEFNHFRIQIPIQAQNSSVIQETLKNQLEYISSIIKKEEHSNNGSNHSSNGGGAHSHNNSQLILGGQNVQSNISHDSYSESYFKKKSQEQENGIPIQVPSNQGPGLIMIQKYIVSNHFNKSDGPPVSTEQQIVQHGSVNAQNLGQNFQVPSQFAQGSNFNYTPNSIPDQPLINHANSRSQTNTSPPNRKKSKSRMSGTQNSGDKLSHDKGAKNNKKSRHSLTNPDQKQSLLDNSAIQSQVESHADVELSQRDQLRLIKLQQILTFNTPQANLSGQLLSQSQLGELQGIEIRQMNEQSPSATPLSLNMRSDQVQSSSLKEKRQTQEVDSQSMQERNTINISPQYIKFQHQSPQKLKDSSKKDSKTQFEDIISSGLRVNDQVAIEGRSEEQIQPPIEGVFVPKDQSRPDSSIWMVTNESIDDDTSVELVGEQVYMRERSLAKKKSLRQAQSSSQLAKKASIQNKDSAKVQSQRYQPREDSSTDVNQKDWDIRQSDTNMFTFPNQIEPTQPQASSSVPSQDIQTHLLQQTNFKSNFQPEPESPPDLNEHSQNQNEVNQQNKTMNGFLSKGFISLIKRYSEKLEEQQPGSSNQEDLASVRRHIEDLIIQQEMKGSQLSHKEEETQLVKGIDYRDYLDSQMPTELKNSVMKIREDHPIHLDQEELKNSGSNDAPEDIERQIKRAIQQEIKKRFSFNDIETQEINLVGDMQNQIETLQILQNTQRSQDRATESPRVDQKPPSRTKTHNESSVPLDNTLLNQISQILNKRHLTMSDQNPATTTSNSNQQYPQLPILKQLAEVMLQKFNTLENQKQSVGSFQTGHFNQSPSDSAFNKNGTVLIQSNGTDPLKKSPLPLAKKVTIKRHDTGHEEDKQESSARRDSNILDQQENKEQIADPSQNLNQDASKGKERIIKSILKKFQGEIASDRPSQQKKKSSFEGEIMIQDENNERSQPPQSATRISEHNSSQQQKQTKPFKKPRVIISSSEIADQDEKDNQNKAADFSKLPPRAPSPTYLNPMSAMNSAENSEPKQSEVQQENQDQQIGQELSSIRQSSKGKRSLGQGNRSTLDLVQSESMLVGARLPIVSQKTIKDNGKSRNKDQRAAMYSHQHKLSLESFENDKSVEDALDENGQPKKRLGTDVFNKTAPYAFNLLKLDLYPSNRSNNNQNTPLEEQKKGLMLRLDSFKHKLVSKEAMLSRQKTNVAQTDSIISRLKEGMKRNIIDEYNEERETKEREQQEKRSMVILEFNTVNTEEEEKKRHEIQNQIQSKLFDMKSNDQIYKKEQTRRKSVKKVVRLNKKPPTASGMGTSNADKLKEALKKKEQDQAELRKLEKMKIKEQFLQKKQATNFLAPGQENYAMGSNSEQRQQSLRVSDSFHSPGGLQLKLAPPSGQASTHPSQHNSQTHSFKQQYGFESAVGNMNKLTALSNILSQVSSTKRSSNPIHRNQYE